jgi:predicted ATPase/class 3 adenylate cyclase
MNNFPTGTVSFLFTDIEGSTRLAREHPDEWEALQKAHHAILRTSMEAHDGTVFHVVGDAFCVAFHTARNAIDAAIQAQRSLQQEEWGATHVKVRMGLHTGAADWVENDYRGYLTLALVQRVMAAAHGGQVLLSNACAAQVRDQLKDGVNLRDMQENRLKGILNPEHLWQVIAPGLQQDFPPLISLNTIPNNLPLQMTSFIGREKEIKEIMQALQHNRLVTLTGSGGTGKTRLSLRVAEEMLETFKDGAWFVELAPLSDPTLVTGTVANLFGVREESGRPLVSTLTDWLKERDLLIILDNCEHLIDACAQFTEGVLHNTPRVHILTSSREALGVPGELAWRVPSLATPDPKTTIHDVKQLEGFAAVQLFIERATFANRAFALNAASAGTAAQICTRLDGIPLAIELAAARIKVLNVEQIAERLNDRFRLLTGGSRTALPRQQTLRAMIDWSYDLLAESERLLLRRLAVFAGGWTLGLAEQSCCDERIDQYNILDMLGRLVDKSLVVVAEGKTETRYRMLETVRQYAREKLFESGEGEQARDRQLQAFIDLVEKGEPEIRGLNQLAWLDRLDEEIDNLRTALEWAQERNKDSFLRLASALWRFWDVRGHIADLEWLPQALAATEGQQTVLRARALGRACYVVLNHGDPHQKRRDWAKEAEILSRSLDDKPGLAMALGMQGCIETDPDKGLALLDKALSLNREIGDHWGAGGAFYGQAGLLMNQNDLASAKLLFEQGLMEARQSGDLRRVNFGLGILGWVALAQGEAVNAEKWFREAHEVALEIRDNPNIFGFHVGITAVKLFLEDYASARDLNSEDFKLAQIDKKYISDALWYSAMIDIAQGKLPHAIEQLEESLLIAEKTSLPAYMGDMTYWLGEAFRRKWDLTGAGIKYREALPIYQKEQLEYGYCLCLEGLGMLAIDQGQAARGVRLLGAREKLRTSVNVWDHFPFITREREAHIASASAQLGEDAFNQAWAEGKAMSKEDALNYAGEEMQ